MTRLTEEEFDRLKFIDLPLEIELTKLYLEKCIAALTRIQTESFEALSLTSDKIKND